MAREITFAMIKPDAVAAKHTGQIIDMIEKNGFTIVSMHKIHMPKNKAHELYAEHSERPFFGEMVEFITSDPLIVLALSKENAIKAWRDLMGATNPAQAEEGTIRKKFGTSIGNNAVHGSDKPESAARELGIFFAKELENMK